MALPEMVDLVLPARSPALGKSVPVSKHQPIGADALAYVACDRADAVRVEAPCF